MNEKDLSNLIVKVGRASTFGWLRRPELNTAESDMWEKPNGQLFAMPKGVQPIVQALDGLPTFLKDSDG